MSGACAPTVSACSCAMTSGASLREVPWYEAMVAAAEAAAAATEAAAMATEAMGATQCPCPWVDVKTLVGLKWQVFTQENKC